MGLNLWVLDLKIVEALLIRAARAFFYSIDQDFANLAAIGRTRLLNALYSEDLGFF